MVAPSAVAEMMWSIGSDRSHEERMRGLRLLAMSPFDAAAWS